MTGFLGGGVPLFEIRDVAGPATDMLVRDGALGRALATALGQRPVVLMRGHGAVAVGASVRQAVFRAVYTEVNAHLQAEASRLGVVTTIRPVSASRPTCSVGLDRRIFVPRFPCSHPPAPRRSRPVLPTLESNNHGSEAYEPCPA